MIVLEPLQAAIWHCLNHYAYLDAIFLAERLCAEVDSDETLFLLATCYYRSGKPGQAYSVLSKKGTRSPQCKYLMAKCCLDLQKLAEAESVITGGDVTKCRNLEDIVNEFGDLACFALQLLAKICSQTERLGRAAEAYRKSLKLNPFLWYSFEDLCNLGEKPDPARTFQVTHLENFNMCHGTNPVVNFVNNQNTENVSTWNLNVTSESTVNTINSTPIQQLNCLNFQNVPSNIRSTPEDSPILTSQSSCNSGPTHHSVSGRGKPYRFRIVFGGHSNVSPLTPSFGVLPTDVSSPGEVSQHSLVFLSPAPAVPPTTLMEANDQKSLAKRVSSIREHVGQLICRKDTPLQPGKAVFSQSGNTSNSANIVSTQTPSPPPAALQVSQNVRRSSRLFSNSYSVKENNKSPNRNKFTAPKSPSRKTKSRLSKSNISKSAFNELNEKNRSEKEKSETITSESKLISNNNATLQNVSQQALLLQKQSAEGLMCLLREIGMAYLYLSQYNCSKAIECLNNLPPQQYNTGWVLSLLGKAYYELTDYQQSVRHFSEVREREPYRMQLMELYSTALWHLQKEVALSALAQDLVHQDRNCAAAWCAAGNCFSLQKEHETAIKFFQRAVQVDPNFAYAHTLLGHEYVTTEELERAMSCFRSAVRIDSRHYNAWYGIGTIFYKQERYQLAEIYFKRALSINPQSSVLMCHIGVVQHALQKTEKALQTLNQAIHNDPKNPLCKFHRASIYFAADRHAEALKELEELKEIVPKESLVYFLTGKVHKKLGNTHLALMHFSWAMDLDPKGANSQIKKAIDPAMSRSQAEEDSSTAHAGDECPSEGSSAPVQESSSQEGVEFPEIPELHAIESDESL